ncbi:MAG: hypothetical protein ACOCXJ_07275 [Planctomycetota bacterium]
MSIHGLGPGDRPRLQALLEEPLPGPIRLRLLDDPFPGTQEGLRWVGILERGALIGAGCRSVAPMWVNGAPCRMGYLGRLRARAGAAGHLPRLRRAFSELDVARSADEASFDWTVVLQHHRVARRLLERDLPGVPCYRPCGLIHTRSWRPRHRGRPSVGMQVRIGGPHALTRLVQLHRQAARSWGLAHRWDQSSLHALAAQGFDPGRIVQVCAGSACLAVAALWDRRPERRIGIAGYEGLLAAGRPVLNALAAWTGMPRLPRPGSTLALAWMSHVAWTTPHPVVFAALVDAVEHVAQQAGITTLACGLPADDPLGAWLQRHRRGPTLVGTCYLVHAATVQPPPLRGPCRPEAACL